MRSVILYLLLIALFLSQISKRIIIIWLCNLGIITISYFILVKIILIEWLMLFIVLNINVVLIY